MRGTLENRIMMTFRFILLVSYLFSLQNCIKNELSEEPVQIDIFGKIHIIPCDNAVYLQWALTEYKDETWTPAHARAFIYRALSGDDFKLVSEFQFPLLKYWSFLDTTALNSYDYQYYIYVRFSLESEPYEFSVSDAFPASPDSGLLDPRPEAPESLAIMASSDSFTLTWIPPNVCDSLYYILISSGGVTYYKSYLNFNPHPEDFYPVKLDSAQYTFENLNDSLVRYYKVIAFGDSIMSKHSDAINRRHD